MNATTRQPTMTPLVIVAIVVTLIAWASAFVVIRGVGEHLGGGELALGRLLVGTVLLSLLLIGRTWVRPNRREWLLILVYGAAWFGAYNVTLNIAEHTLDAGTTSMIVNIGPILIALGAGVFLGEGVPRWLAIGAGVSFGGVVLIGLGFLAFGEIPTVLAIIGGTICLVGVALSRRASPPPPAVATGSALPPSAAVPEAPQNLSQ